MKHENGTFTLSKDECTALLAYACTDETRTSLHQVHFAPRNGAVYATDGHTLVRAQNCARHEADDFGVARDNFDYAARMLRRKDHELSVWRLRDKVLLEVRCGGVPLGLVEARAPEGDFPPAEQVIPQYTHQQAPAELGIDAVYLARLQLVGKAAGDTRMRIQHHGPLDPILAVVENVPGGVTWTVVTMPVRI